MLNNSDSCLWLVSFCVPLASANIRCAILARATGNARISSFARLSAPMTFFNILLLFTAIIYVKHSLARETEQSVLLNLLILCLGGFISL